MMFSILVFIFFMSCLVLQGNAFGGNISGRRRRRIYMNSLESDLKKNHEKSCYLALKTVTDVKIGTCPNIYDHSYVILYKNNFSYLSSFYFVICDNMCYTQLEMDWKIKSSSRKIQCYHIIGFFLVLNFIYEFFCFLLERLGIVLL